MVCVFPGLAVGHLLPPTPRRLPAAPGRVGGPGAVGAATGGGRGVGAEPGGILCLCWKLQVLGIEHDLSIGIEGSSMVLVSNYGFMMCFIFIFWI